MTDDEHAMMKRVHDYLFHPPMEGKPTRAAQLDEVLGAVRAGKLGTRVLLWLAGIVAAASAIWMKLPWGLK